MKSENDKIQLCKVGDTLYRVSKVAKEDKLYVEPITITVAEYVTGRTFGHWYYRDNKKRSYFNRNIESTCFKTKEEAEQEIQRKQNITKKRKLLKEYERELNEELNLKNNYIIK